MSESSLGERYAEIVSPDELAEIRRERDLGRVVCTSGGYDPIHPGHLTCIIESKSYGDTLVVVVNGDAFLTAKKGKPFQDLETRSRIVSCVREVDFVVPFEIADDSTVNEALRAIRPDVFTKGGDRIDSRSIAEWKLCEELGIEVVTGVGLQKAWSSSNFLKDWGDFVLKSRTS